MLDLLIIGAAALFSVAAIRLAMAFSEAYGLVDHPGDHKAHKRSTPFVGGFGILSAFALGVVILDQTHPELRFQWLLMATAAFAIFITGLTDDLIRLGFRLRLLVQTGAALVMTLGAGVILIDLGPLLLGHPLHLAMLAIPFTLFATVGGINALNMMDGIDGLAGTLSFVTMALIAVLIALAGGSPYYMLVLCLLGGLAGFLYFNLRHHGQPCARVFMGDNGSMLLGLLFAWILVGLSQGEGSVIQPVAALSLFVIPLLDTLSVILRRLWLGRSPFTPDRSHLHHLLQRAGFRVDHAVAFITLLHLVLATAGLVLLHAGVPEWLMLAGFLALFAGYFYLTVRPWRVVPTLRRLHTRMTLVPATTTGIYIGDKAARDPKALMRALAEELDPSETFCLRIYEHNPGTPQAGIRYALVEIPLEDEEANSDAVTRYTRRLKNNLSIHQDLTVRALVARKRDNDPRQENLARNANQRCRDRRIHHACTLVFEAHAFVQRGLIVDGQVRDMDWLSHPDPQALPKTRPQGLAAQERIKTEGDT
ncbi:MraY family glycosyltransferase [Ectothiorhodospira shaposhnikovii]|uniref:MraY family glycosyltransferase n=1 Tax=Ectothiorhodospira shaposhnikovii TaxID=1054 RepID=UPI001EE8D8EB|nr:undecaprenyl/decaprenyl-phosphate alpha-N-acetylglucosaminyl 1-phosphate transferase [Ectothiorhodospira shaposhnikovii]